MSTAKQMHFQGITVSEEMISPDLAARWLEQNTTNRPLVQAKVISLAEAIKRGEWMLDGATIRFSESGQLLDGQHRLTAIQKAGIPCRSLVVNGIADDAVKVMDTGKTRSVADVFAIRGVKSANNVAAVVRSLMVLQSTGNPAATGVHVARVTPSAALAFLAGHEGLEEEICRRTNRWVAGAKGLFPLGIGIAMYLTVAKVHPREAGEFFDTFYGVTAGAIDDPAWKLRERFTAARNNKAKSLTTETKAAFLVKSWNAYRDNTTIERLTWRKFGARAEQFPRLDELDS